MSKYTRSRHSPQRQMHSNNYTQTQHGVAHQEKLPFPNKPVSHRKPNNPRMQDSFDLHDLGKMTINKDPRVPLLPKEHHSNGRDATRSQYPGGVTHKQPIGELEMTRAIREKQLMLREKLWRVEAKARQRVESAQQNIALGDDYNQKQEEKVKTETKAKLLKQQREPVRSKGVMMQHREQEDVKQRTMGSMTNTKEQGEGDSWKTLEKHEQFQRKGCQSTQKITAHKQETSGQRDTLNWENQKDHTRERGRFERDGGIQGEINGKSTEKGQERGQSTMSKGNKGLAREKNYREDTYKKIHDSDNEHHRSQHKTSHQNTTQNSREAGGNPSEEQPALSSPHCSTQDQEELSFPDSMDSGHSLLPCKFCDRKFASKRLEKHMLICAKVKNTNRKVFNSFTHRTKGTALGDYLKTHRRPGTPEAFKKKKKGPTNMAHK